MVVVKWKQIWVAEFFSRWRWWWLQPIVEFPIPDICRGHCGRCPWRKNLSCGEISNFCTWQMWRNLKFLHMWINFTFLHMTDVEKSEISFIMCTIYGILLHFTLFWCRICLFLRFTLFCRKIGLLRFMLYCVEKMLAKNSARGEKVTNIRYVYIT